MPTRGTTTYNRVLKLDPNFNPRAHEGHDAPALLPGGCTPISIHVPTRGTTHAPAPVHVSNYFNPRAHEGHDLRKTSRLNRWIFQSTCPRGARRQVGTHIIKFVISIHVPTRGTTTALHRRVVRLNFNPRAHEGHDVMMLCVMLTSLFQSTCPRGARPDDVVRNANIIISIHVPTRGTT